MISLSVWFAELLLIQAPLPSASNSRTAGRRLSYFLVVTDLCITWWSLLGTDPDTPGVIISENNWLFLPPVRIKFPSSSFNILECEVTNLEDYLLGAI